MSSPPTSGSWSLAQTEDRYAVRPSGCTFYLLTPTFDATAEGLAAAEAYVREQWPAGAEIRRASVTLIPR